MLPSNIQWFFPSKSSEAIRLIRKKGFILHAGGTKILEPEPRGSVKALVDISGLGLDYIRAAGSTVRIGAGSTFADIVEFCRTKEKLILLRDCLSHAASNPLRNRITVGGSLNAFPMWSNLYAPLLALDASVEIVGARSGIYPLEQYADSNIIGSKHLIKEVRVAETKGVITAARTFRILRFEYPIFTIAAALGIKKQTVRSARIFVTGVRRKFARLVSVEKMLVNNSLTDELIVKACDRASMEFVQDYRFSPAYKERIARLYLSEILREIGGAGK
ncbi:MAG TPA: FAD binding domain-containing protein [Bacteroidota bacterium]|nr:FAD binding domain-containing protein [Bacteroidota bacterium]